MRDADQITVNPYFADWCFLTESLDETDHPDDHGGLAWRVSWNKGERGYSIALVFASEMDAKRAALSLFENGIMPSDIDEMESHRVWAVMTQDLQW